MATNNSSRPSQIASPLAITHSKERLFLKIANLVTRSTWTTTRENSSKKLESSANRIQHHLEEEALRRALVDLVKMS